MNLKLKPVGHRVKDYYGIYNEQKAATITSIIVLPIYFFYARSVATEIYNDSIVPVNCIFLMVPFINSFFNIIVPAAKVVISKFKCKSFTRSLRKILPGPEQPRTSSIRRSISQGSQCFPQF